MPAKPEPPLNPMKSVYVIHSAHMPDPFSIEIDDSPYLVPEPPTLAERLRDAVAAAGKLVVGTNPEALRIQFLAGATCPADLERRMRAWERPRGMRQGLPLVL